MSKKSWIIENKWNCSSCGKADNRGRDMKCSQCGSPKEKHEKYTVNAAAPAVTDRKMLEQAHAGKHWNCSFCQNQNRDLERKECAHCGAPRDSGATPEAVDDGPPRRPSWSPREPVNSRAYGALMAYGFAMLIGGLFWLFSSKEEPITVSGVRWTCTANLYQRETRHDEGWRSSMPSSAFNTFCTERQDGWRDCRPYSCNAHEESYSCNPYECNCHTSCRDLNNGYSSCSEHCSTCYRTCSKTVHDTCYHSCPVYRDWCSYEYYAWPAINTLVATNIDYVVQCPELIANGPLQRAEKNIQYTVGFSSTEKTWVHNPSTLQEYKRYLKGAVWIAETNRAGGFKPLHPKAK